MHVTDYSLAQLASQRRHEPIILPGYPFSDLILCSFVPVVYGFGLAQSMAQQTLYLLSPWARAYLA